MFVKKEYNKKYLQRWFRDMVEELLANQKYMLLTSFRKDGTGVATPVWFVFTSGKIFFSTTSKAWKVKRIQNNPKVEVCPCSIKGKVLGKSCEAEAHILEGSDAQEAKSHLQKKYGIMYTFLRFGSWLKRSKYVFIEVIPGSIKEEDP